MALGQWYGRPFEYGNPFEALDALRRDFERTFGWFDNGRRPAAVRGAFLPGRSARAYPLLNISEEAEAYRVWALAPGIDPDHLSISMTGNQLSISGRKAPLAGEIQPEHFHRNERAVGNFARTIALPCEVDESKIAAQYKNGILEVTLPKAEKAKPKRISVNVA